jgi:hypothetical protein
MYYQLNHSLDTASSLLYSKHSQHPSHTSASQLSDKQDEPLVTRAEVWHVLEAFLGLGNISTESLELSSIR